LDYRFFFLRREALKMRKGDKKEKERMAVLEMAAILPIDKKSHRQHKGFAQYILETEDLTGK
jgi:hypothetical protein